MNKKVLFIFLLVICSLFIPSVYAEANEDGKIVIDCPKTTINDNEKIICNIKVTGNSFDFNAVTFNTTYNGYGNFEGKNGFEYKSEIIDTCVKCIGETCKCLRSNAFISNTSVAKGTEVIIGTYTVTGSSAVDKVTVAIDGTIGITDIATFNITKPSFNKSGKLNSVYQVINISHSSSTTTSTGSLAIDCPKSQLEVGESMSCSIKVTTTNYKYNAFVFQTLYNGYGNFEGKNGFEYKSAVTSVACAKCIGENCKCTRMNSFINKNTISSDGTVIVGTYTLTAPETPTTLTITIPGKLGKANYNNYNISNPTLSDVLNLTAATKTIKVVEKQTTTTSTAFPILDCPKSQLKTGESMTCTLKVNSKNFSYNTVKLDSNLFRNYTLVGKNGYVVKENISCKKCPGCGCNGTYYFFNSQNIDNNSGVNEIGTIVVTAPDTEGPYDIVFNTIIGNGLLTDTGYPGFVGDTMKTSLNKSLTIVSSSSTPSNPSSPTTNMNSDNSLSSLELYSNGNIIPIDFNSDRTDYTLIVDGTVAEITVKASLNDSEASFIEGFGPRTTSIEYGLSKIILKVKAEDGSIAIYTINISRTPDDVESPITAIIVNGVEIAIQNGKYDYMVEVDNNSIYTDIEFKKKSDDVLINYSNIELEEGNNDLEIKVMDEDGNNYVYSLVIYRAPQVVTADVALNITIIASVIILLILGTLFVSDIFKKNK